MRCENALGRIGFERDYMISLYKKEKILIEVLFEKRGLCFDGFPHPGEVGWGHLRRYFHFNPAAFHLHIFVQQSKSFSSSRASD